jgi:uncharacterized protein
MHPEPHPRRHGPFGVGLGLRWDFLEEVVDGEELAVAFFEVSPENYMRRGGYYPAALEQVRDRYTLVSHGLTLSLGATTDPDPTYLRELRAEIVRLGTPWHSDHLCFSSSGERMLHELLPLKFSLENVQRVADRLRRVEDFLGVPMAIENITWYAHPGKPELSEAEFIGQTLERSGAGLLLDVNNVYVNAQNHGFDPSQFLRQIPLDRVIQIHVAGHSRLDSGLILDTHGAKVCDPVHELLGFVLEQTGPLPVLLERDNHIPELSELMAEVRELRAVYERSMTVWEERHARSA